MDRKVISSLLLRLGIPPALKGFDYIITAVQLIIEDRSLLHSMVKGLYPAVAEKYGVSVQQVERGIRHAIYRSIDRVGDDTAEIFGNVYNPKNKYKPTNSEYISTVAEYLINERK